MNIFLSIIDLFNFFSNLERFYLFIPEIFLSLSIIFMFIKNIFFNLSNSNNSVNKLCIIYLFITLILIGSINFESLGFPKLSASSFFFNNLKIIITICLIFIFFIAKSNNNIDRVYSFEFHILCLLSTLGMLILVSSTNFISLYLAIELQMIPIYFICKLNDKSFEFSIKFFLIGFLSSIIILLGIFLIFSYSYFINFNDIKSLFSSQINNEMLIGFNILLVGIFFKIFFPPFHMFLPDLFESFPSPIALFICTSSFISFIGVLLLFNFNLMDEDTLNWKKLLLILSAFSIFIGALGMFLQKNIKRFFGYFCIVNIGYILLAISLMSYVRFENIIVYLTTYVFLLFGLFLIIILLTKDEKSIENLYDLSDLSSSKPLISLSLLVFLFSMSGIPPFAGFFSKWLVFLYVIEKNNIYILLLVISSSFLITFSCLKIIKIMYFETSDFQFKVKKNTQLKFIMFLCLIINIFMFIVISPLVDAIVNVSNSIF